MNEYIHEEGGAADNGINPSGQVAVSNIKH